MRVRGSCPDPLTRFRHKHLKCLHERAVRRALRIRLTLGWGSLIQGKPLARFMLARGLCVFRGAFLYSPLQCTTRISRIVSIVMPEFTLGSLKMLKKQMFLIGQNHSIARPVYKSEFADATP